MNPWCRDEYITTIGAAGDFSDETDWMTAFDSVDLSDRTTQVFGIENLSGDFNVGETITWRDGNGVAAATATVIHNTATQVLVEDFSGIAIVGMEITGAVSTETADTTDAGRLAHVVGEWIDITAIVGGLTITVGSRVGGASGTEPPGFFVLRAQKGTIATPGTWTGAKQISNAAGVALTINLPWFRIEGVAIGGRDGGVLVDTSGAASTGLVVIGSDVIVGPVAQTGNPAGVQIDYGKVLFMGSASYGWLGDGINVDGANASAHVYRSTIYRNTTYGVRCVNGSTAYCRDNVFNANNSGPMLNVADQTNNITNATRYQLGFTVPDYGDPTGWDLHYTALVVSETEDDVQVYMKGNPGLSENTDSVGWYHPCGLDYRVKPQGGTSRPANSGPMDIGADDYHYGYTPSGSGPEIIAPLAAVGGGTHRKFRLTDNKTADGSAFYLRANIHLQLDEKTVTYGNDPTAVSALEGYTNFPVGFFDAGSGTIYWTEGGGSVVQAIVNATTGAITFTARIGHEGDANNEFRCPTGVCKIGTSLYVADIGRKRVVKIHATTGAYEDSYELADWFVETSLADWRPWGIATNGTDRIYIADHASQIILVLDNTLAYVTHWDFTAEIEAWEAANYTYHDQQRTDGPILPTYWYGITYRGGALYAVTQLITVKMTIAADAKPAWAWIYDAGGMAVDKNGSYVCVSFQNEITPRNWVRQLNDSDGSSVKWWQAGYLQPSYGGGFDSNSGFYIHFQELGDRHVPVDLVQVWDITTTSAAMIWSGFPFGTITGIISVPLDSSRHAYQARDIAVQPDSGTVSVYGGTITKASGPARGMGFYSSNQFNGIHDCTINLRGMASFAIWHQFGGYGRINRNIINCESHLISHEGRERQWPAGEICFEEHQTGMGSEIKDNKINGGNCGGIIPGPYNQGEPAAVVLRNFINLDAACYPRDAAPTNVAAISAYGYETTIRHCEIANRRGHGLHLMLHSTVNTADSTFRECRSQSSYRSSGQTSYHYPAEGAWQRNVDGSLHEDCQMVAYHRFPHDRFLAPVYMTLAGAGATYRNCELYGRRGFQSHFTGLAAIRLGRGSENVVIDNCVLNSEGTVVACWVYSAALANVVFRECTMQQVFGRDGSIWRHTFHVEHNQNYAVDVTFEDCVWEQEARPDSVYLDRPRSARIRFLHENHMTVEVTDGGVPVVGAAVSVYDKEDTLIATGTTGALGTVVPIRVDTGSTHLFCLEWTNDEGGTINNRGPFRVYATDGATKDGEVTADLTLGPDDTVEVPIVVGSGNPAPTVTACVPLKGPTSGGTAVTITGTGFDTVGGCNVTFGGAAAAAIVVVSPTQITCNTPAYGTSGAVEVVVQNIGDGKSGSKANAFSYYITSSDPIELDDPFTAAPLGANWNEITADGGEMLQPVAGCYSLHDAGPPPDNYPESSDWSRPTYTGTQDNDQKTRMHIRRVNNDDWVYEIWARRAGNVWETDFVGYCFRLYSSTGVPTQRIMRKDAVGYVYLNNDSSGLPTFVNDTEYILELECVGTSITARILNASETVLWTKTETDATYAAGVGGWGAYGGNGNTYGNNRFERCILYNVGGAPANPAPTVTGVVANTGTTAGGTSVTITGTNFEAGDRVWFGVNEATNVIVVNPTTITCDTPQAVGPGPVEVRVVDTDAQEGALSPGFTYEATPTIVSITPATGLIAGGNRVTITGTEFFPMGVVYFDGMPGTLFTHVSRTEIQITTPPGPEGLVDVRVLNVDGEFVDAVNGFRYTAPPLPTQDPVIINQLDFSATVHGTGRTSITRRTNPARRVGVRRIDELPTDFRKAPKVERPTRKTGPYQ